MLALSVIVSMPWKRPFRQKARVLPEMLRGQRPRIVLFAQRQAVHEHVLIEGPCGAASAAPGLGHVEKDAAVEGGMKRRIEVDAVVELLRQGRNRAVVGKMVAGEFGPGHQQGRADRAVRSIPAAARRPARGDVHEVHEVAVGGTLRHNARLLAGVRGKNRLNCAAPRREACPNGRAR